MKKYLALDVGDRRIGVAKCDAAGIVVTPLEVIDRKKTKALLRIAELCRAEEISSIVAGIPKSLDGTEKRQAEKVRAFLEKLQEAMPGVEIIEVDERYTTTAADRILNEIGEKGAPAKRKRIDKIAAALILETFLQGIQNFKHIPSGGKNEEFVD
ncbi:MAG: Holliday junction resolvase RuvX [Fusobacteriaceae bacterium]|jgi:putative Holliday junction resolvase|nr:Holliday junction resolvase RuvX [Fusobacteriaceae bacterium]